MAIVQSRSLPGSLARSDKRPSIVMPADVRQLAPRGSSLTIGVLHQPHRSSVTLMSSRSAKSTRHAPWRAVKIHAHPFYNLCQGGGRPETPSSGETRPSGVLGGSAGELASPRIWASVSQRPSSVMRCVCVAAPPSLHYAHLHAALDRAGSKGGGKTMRIDNVSCVFAASCRAL